MYQSVKICMSRPAEETIYLPASSTVVEDDGELWAPWFVPENSKWVLQDWYVWGFQHSPYEILFEINIGTGF